MHIFLKWLAFATIFFSCASYKQSIMLKSSENWQQEANRVERDFAIQKNDILRLEVNSNKGERLVDPNPELTNTNINTAQNVRQQIDYLVDQNGVVKFPMIGELKLEGLTLRQAEEIVQQEYAGFFKEPFVQLSFVNKRVVILGATGGQVIPLVNQNMTLAEIIALAKGLPNDSKAQSIKVMRGDKVYLVDLSTLEGFQKGNMIMEPNDIVYVEPVIRPLSEGLRDFSGVFTMIVSITTLIAVITNLR